MAREEIVFDLDDKHIVAYPGPANSPVVYLNSYIDDSREISSLLAQKDCPPHSLVVISHLAWDDEMSPWECPALTEDDTPCTGGADTYLVWLTQTLIPKVEKHFSGEIPYRALAGYSLAGLFALYAPYKTSIFSRIASMSGSLWFPDFISYIKSNKMVRKPDCIFLSLGETEDNSPIPMLDTVRIRTEEAYTYFQDLSIPSMFRLNPGDHLTECSERTVAGIRWILEHENTPCKDSR